jgi:cell division septum initiation protein DivIVA
VLLLARSKFSRKSPPPLLLEEDELDDELDSLDEELDSLEDELDSLDEELDSLDEELDSLDDELDSLLEELDELLDELEELPPLQVASWAVPASPALMVRLSIATLPPDSVRSAMKEVAEPMLAVTLTTVLAVRVPMSRLSRRGFSRARAISLSRHSTRVS